MNLAVHHFRSALYLVAAVLSIFLLIVFWQERVQEARGISFGADLPILKAIDVPALGINAALQETDGEARERALTILRDGGYSWVRQPFPWRDIELTKAHFSWERWDSLVSSYRQHGLRLVAVLDRPPDWSRQDNNWPNRPPDRPDDFGDFVAAFASRYRGQVDYLQIWDEPNVFPNWGNRAVDPAQYTALLTTAYRRAKEANPAAVVLMAGLAPNDESGGRNMSDLLFLDGMYHAGAASFFDIAAVKPYGLWYQPYGQHNSADTRGFSRLLSWRGATVAHGDGAKPIWAVEFGWNSLPDDWTGQASVWGSVSQKEQADYTVSAYRRAQTEWPWLPALFLQGYRPATSADDPRWGFSVVDERDHPKPVYEAVRDFASSPAAPIGYHPGASPYIVKTGNWQSKVGDLSFPPGSSLAFRFVGTRLDVMVARGPQAGLAAVTIDNRPPNRLPLFDNTALLDASASATYWDRVTIADDLPMGDHALALSVLPRPPAGAHRADSAAPMQIAGFYAVRDHPVGFTPWISLLLFLCAVVLTQRLVTLALGWRAFRSLQKRIFLLLVIVQSAADDLVSRWQLLSSQWRDWLVFTATACLIVAAYLLPFPLAALAALGIFLGVWLRPTALAMLLIAAAPFVALPIHLSTGEFSAAELLALTSAVIVVCRYFIGPTLRPKPRSCRGITASVYCARWASRGFNAPIALLLVAALVSTALAAQQREALRELRTVILEPIMLYVIVVRARQLVGDKNWNDARFVNRLFDVLIIVGFTVALIALYQYFFTSDVITAEGVRRARALYGSPNNLGLFLGRVVPIAAYVGAIDRHRRWYLIALAFQLTALVLSFSVGAWLAVAAAALFLAVLRGRRLMLAAAGSVLLVFAGVGAFLPVERIVAHLNLDQGTSRMRLLIWEGALNMLRDHPFVGVGPDNFLSHYRDHYMLPDAWREPNLSHPHNLLLDFWLRLGLMGFAAGVWLLYRYFSLGIRLYVRIRHTEHRALVAALLASMVCFVTHGLVDNSLFLVDLALLFWLSCGALEVIRREHYNTGSVEF